MTSNELTYRSTNFANSLVCEYIEGKEELDPFYNRKPNSKNFLNQLREKQLNYANSNRSVLSETIKDQYKHINFLCDKVEKNISTLADNKTFTITTGHQLNIMTGPMYFIYKIITTINLVKKLSKDYPEYKFIPIYWMASEDHDLEEISNFNFKGKNFKWNKKSSGPVGKLSNNGLKELFNVFTKELSKSQNGKKIKKLIKQSYLSSKNLANATRVLVNEIFGQYGLVIIDPSEKKLKKLFIPYMKDEIMLQDCERSVLKTLKTIQKKYDKNYKPQVNPRDINLFFLSDNNRKRIFMKSKGVFALDASDVIFKEKELLEILNLNPEKFSPNVLMRPLYQEVILPNLCYVGGGGELSYWLELKNYFDVKKISFPIILHRNSALIIDYKTSKKIKNLNLKYEDLFLSRSSLINKKVRQISDIDLDLSFLKNTLKNQFAYLQDLVLKTDSTFNDALTSQMIKQNKGIDDLEKRLLKAQRNKLSDHVNRLTIVHETLFPGGRLQERIVNFSEFYEIYGPELIELLMNNLDPYSGKFNVFEFSN